MTNLDKGTMPFGRLQLGWRRRLPMVMQTEVTECGLACMAMIASFHGHDVDLMTLRRSYPSSLKGLPLSRLMALSGTLGLSCRPLRLELDEIHELKAPAILHWDLSHYVVLRNVSRGGMVIHDPARGVRHLSMSEVSEHFTGVAVEITPSEAFTRTSERAAVAWRDLIGRLVGVVPALFQIALFALGLEVLSLVAPLYVQWLLDQVVVSADHDLLTLLGLGFGGVAVFSALFTAARSWSVTSLGASVGVQWSANLFQRLVRLPLDWYQKRHVGDVISRFNSLQTVQRTLTTQFIASIIDGLMSLVTLVIMALYSVKLTLLVAGILALYAGTRWLVFSPLQRANEEQIVYEAKRQSELLESVRGAMTIKLAGKQRERLVRFTNATVDAANKDVGIQRITIGFTLGNQLAFGLGRVAMLWIAGGLALKNEMSTGMLVAFVAFSDQFTARAIGLVDKLVDFRMLRMHAERIADIALAETEATDDDRGFDEQLLADASIELRGVSFRYSDGEPWIVHGCNLQVDSGQSVALIGPSGCGKTTLAKIMLGLLRPTEGKVLFGGIEIEKLGLSAYRKMVGAVMQDDQLFAGSISDNISFFDPDLLSADVMAAAKKASVHDDITAMPMGYQSLVGDMGSTLSGGQKQRVLLARALCRHPRLLVLDEATSHLDMARERAVNDAIKGLCVTRVLIAHRTETIASADVVFAMSADAGVCQVQSLREGAVAA